jgi:hypothetical protein
VVCPFKNQLNGFWDFPVLLRVILGKRGHRLIGTKKNYLVEKQIRDTFVTVLPDFFKDKT